jgi:putative membrane protein
MTSSLQVAGQLLWRFRFDLLAVLGVAAAMVFAADRIPMQNAAAVVPVLGIVVSIFIGFRNRNAYNRWWEARTLWGAILINGRSLNYALTAYDDGQPEMSVVLDRMRRREARHAWQLAAELRGSPGVGLDVLTPEDPPDASAAELLRGQAADIAVLSCAGLIDRQARRVLVTINSAQVGATEGLERIRNQPIPRYYDLFIRALAWTFAVLVCTRIDGVGHDAIVGVLVGILVMALFVIAERIGRLLEEPLSDNVFGIGLDGICARLTEDLSVKPIGDR